MTTVRTMTIVEFLRARLDEDEALARESEGEWTPLGPNPSDQRPIARLMLRHDPARVLREVEAKRQILALASTAQDMIDEEPAQFMRGHASAYNAVLKRLALPYSDHPDYDEAWRP